jgi:hypothetical protein
MPDDEIETHESPSPDWARNIVDEIKSDLILLAEAVHHAKALTFSTRLAHAFLT